MVQRPCPRCGTPCSVERCPNCGADVPPSVEAILAGGELLTHGRPEPVGEPFTPAPPHVKDVAYRTVEIPVSGYSKGAYLIEVRVNGKTFSRPVSLF